AHVKRKNSGANWEATVSKRIIFCADGTWLAPRNNTNVYRLFKGLVNSQDQLATYDDGVGADGSGIARLIQGATGDGLLQKIKDGYTKICHAYETGDQIFLFGFSRGAYTARSLAGMIASCGVPGGPFTNTLVDQVFEAYRNPTQRDALLAPMKSQLTFGASEFIGVWDTVGSLGIPAIFGGFDEKAFGFLDTKLHPDVKQAFHCVSIDERRRQFQATLWDEPGGAGQTLQQVYFAGCHGDVGGGTVVGGGVDDATRLCDIPLSYMVAKAQAAGLEFDPAFLAQCVELPTEYSLDKYTDSWTPEFQLPLSRTISTSANLANSVPIRIKYALTYLPPNLSIDSGELAASYGDVEVVTPE
ncbi:MAG: DUF2235 domain-containing protein, partial [Bryocella sp.]